jgi:hypothetical protein
MINEATDVPGLGPPFWLERVKNALLRTERAKLSLGRRVSTPQRLL